MAFKNQTAAPTAQNVSVPLSMAANVKSSPSLLNAALLSSTMVNTTTANTSKVLQEPKVETAQVAVK